MSYHKIPSHPTSRDYQLETSHITQDPGHSGTPGMSGNDIPVDSHPLCPCVGDSFLVEEALALVEGCVGMDEPGEGGVT